MRIIFVSGNREQLPDAVIPLGLLYVMASVSSEHEKHLLDLCFADDPRAALRAALRDFQPDLVALGMRNIQNNDYSGLSDNLNYYAGLIDTIHDNSSAPVVLGGSGFSVMPQELMAELKPEFGIAGEGEEAFPALVSALEKNGEGLESVGGLYRLEAGSVKTNPKPPSFLDMTQLENPDRRLADARYYREFGIDSVQTKRGCPLRCDYCTYPIIEGRVGRVRRPEAVVAEMQLALAQQPGINHFFIVDSVFNLPKTHAKNVCRELIAQNWSIPWTCYANPLGFDEEFAGLARQAACAGMEIGSDSGCDEVLDRLHKGFTTEHVRRLHRICVEAEIPDCHTFILGTEGESLDDVKRSLDFIVDLDPFSAIIMIWVDDYETLDPELRAKRQTLRRKIEELLVMHKADFPQWSIPALGINFSEDLFKTLRASGMHGPLWQHVRGPARYKRISTPVHR